MPLCHQGVPDVSLTYHYGHQVVAWVCETTGTLPSHSTHHEACLGTPQETSKQECVLG